MMLIAKMPNGKLYEVMQVVDKVKFDDRVGWVLLHYPMGDYTRSLNFELRWVHASTRFEWIRKFNF